MTNNIDIDLASIPHPKDCYPVPVEAVIPKGTPVWRIHSSGLAAWSQNGYANEYLAHEADVIHLTANPIITHPTPDDSPIIITRVNKDEVEAGLLAVWAPRDQEWCVVGSDGYTHWLKSDEITDWSPAIVTKTGRGLWDERDKRDRVDAGGDTWHWDDDRAVWVCRGAIAARLGSLNAFRVCYGDDFLTGFADEQGGEE